MNINTGGQGTLRSSPWLTFLGFVLNPKYEKKLIVINHFSSCVLSQEEVDLQEYHVGAKDFVTL